jgi:type I restriction enzyme R subunit
LGLNDDEVACYDALAQNNSALEVMGKDNLKVSATELVTKVRKSVTIDWTLRESARPKIKVLVKRIEIRSLPTLTHCSPRSFTFYVVHPRHSIPRKRGYPPDLQDEATKLVLQQAELLCAEWAA